MADTDTNQALPIDDEQRQRVALIPPIGQAVRPPMVIAGPDAQNQARPTLGIAAPNVALAANAPAPAAQPQPVPAKIAGPAPAAPASAVAAPAPRATIAPPNSGPITASESDGNTGHEGGSVGRAPVRAFGGRGAQPSAAAPAQTPQPVAMAAPGATPVSPAPTLGSIAPPTAGPIAGTPTGANIHAGMIAPPTAQSGVGRLWSVSGKIGGDNPTLKDKILRDVARVGTGVLTAGDVAAESLDPRMASLIPGSEINTNLKNDRAWQQSMQTAQLDLDRQKEAERDTERQAARQADNARATHDQAETDLAEEEVNKLKEKPDDKFLYHDVDDNGNAVAVFQGQNGPYMKPLGYQGGARPTNRPNFTSPFEAFAYGSPDEKKAAQDFLGIEKRLGRENDKPSEIEERYSLYQKDPDAYRAMFGNRGESQNQAQASRDQAQASRMLKYFDGRRKEIQNDFMLDDTEKEQKLGELDQLEKPYRDAAQPTGNRGRGPAGDTVQVINPQGVPGTMPRANLQKALKKGYKLAGAQ